MCSKISPKNGAKTPKISRSAGHARPPACVPFRQLQLPGQPFWHASCVPPPPQPWHASCVYTIGMPLACPTAAASWHASCVSRWPPQFWHAACVYTTGTPLATPTPTPPVHVDDAHHAAFSWPLPAAGVAIFCQNDTWHATCYHDASCTRLLPVDNLVENLWRNTDFEVLKLLIHRFSPSYPLTYPQADILIFLSHFPYK